jgi:hypothetical protein
MTTTVADSKTPAAGGKAPAAPIANATPSSGEALLGGEQKAAGKEPAAPADKTGLLGKDKDDNAGDTTKSGTPAPYTYKPSPDGFEVGEQPGAALTEVARELNLSNDAAQKIVDKVAPALIKQQESNTASMIAGWLAETKADPVVGGKNLQETLELAEAGFALCPDLRQLLLNAGLTKHKTVLAGFAAIGRKVSPDRKVVQGTPASPPPKTPQERLADSYNK